MRNKTKYIVSLFLIILIISVSPLSTFAGGWGYDNNDDIFYYGVEDDKATIVGITDISFEGELIIPSTLGGYPVEGINLSAFAECTGITSVIISDGVETIGMDAFSGCVNLSSVVIPDSVTLIAFGAFYDTAYSDNDENYENGILYIGDCLIFANDNLSGKVVLKNGTRLISMGAFMSCADVTEIVFPDGFTTICPRSLCYCTELTSISLPESVNSIGFEAFEDCTALTDIYYSGTEQQKNEIEIGEGNEYLLNANWHYNCKPAHIPGDINDDGAVNNKDLVRLFQHLSKWNVSVNEPALDINGDKSVNNKDLVRLFQYLSRWQVEIS